MKKLIFVMVFVLLLAVATANIFLDAKGTAAELFEKVNIVDAKVEAQFLNVRQGPSQSFPIVCVLKKGDMVKVFGKLGSWYAVYEPVKGCVGVVAGQFISGSGLNPSAQKPISKPSATKPPVIPAKPTATPAKPQGKPTVMPTPVGQLPSEQAGVEKDEELLLQLVNKARNQSGIEPLNFDMNLMKVARLKAKDMVENNYFAHQSPTYGSPFDMVRQFGVVFRTAGENIAGHQTVEGAVNAWLNSEGHRKNIMNPSFNYTGIGIVDSPVYGKILVQQFIGR